MVANVAGNMYGMCPNIYNNQIAMNDLSNMNMYYQTGMCFDPLLSMNGSIFGGGYGMMPGMIPGTMPGMMPGMGYMPPFMGGVSSGGGSNGSSDPYEDYYRQYERYQDFMIDNSVRMQQKQRNADLQLSAPNESVQAHAFMLKDKIIRNEQGQIKGAYDAFVESVQALYGDNADRSQVISRANKLYMAANGGQSIVQDIRKYGRDSFTQGAIQSATFGLFNRKTAEETVSELTGQPVGKEENAKKVAGNIVGGMAVGGGTFLLTSPLIKASKALSKSRTAWGCLIGGIAGGLAAILGR